MRNRTLLILLLIGANAFAQQRSNSFVDQALSSGNYLEIKEKADTFFSLFPDTSESGGEAQFERWDWFWKTRVDLTSSSSDGNFRHAINSLLSILTTPICTSGTSTNWTNLGPGITPISDQTLGMISSIAFDQNDPSNTLYVGTPNGGLWKTTNAGQTWLPLTESLHLPGLGVQYPSGELRLI